MGKPNKLFDQPNSFHIILLHLLPRSRQAHSLPWLLLAISSRRIPNLQLLHSHLEYPISCWASLWVGVPEHLKLTVTKAIFSGSPIPDKPYLQTSTALSKQAECLKSPDLATPFHTSSIFQPFTGQSGKFYPSPVSCSWPFVFCLFKPHLVLTFLFGQWQHPHPRPSCFSSCSISPNCRATVYSPHSWGNHRLYYPN